MSIDPTTLLRRVERALSAARRVFAGVQPGDVAESRKVGGDPVTETDTKLDRVLREMLHEPGEGWLSEETADDHTRLDHRVVWIVDPLDGTREFIDGLPEFCVSVAAVVDGRPVAGGVLNPAADIEIAGSIEDGVWCNGSPAEKRDPKPLAMSRVLASRSECSRGQWDVVEASGIEVLPMGSVAYKLARVAAGLDDATWTPVPKHEWDLAGGAALLAAAGGSMVTLDGQRMRFNQTSPWVSGAIAVPMGFQPNLESVIALTDRQRVNAE